MLQNLRLWLLRRALLSASASHHQRAAEIGRKHCCENPAAVARNGENNLPPLHWREQPAGGGWGQRWVRVPRVLASREVPRARPCTAAALEECSVLSFWPVRCTRTSLLAAAWQKENVADKYLQGRRKAAQIDVCAPSPALGWEENRACKMLGPSCSAKAKALWRDLSPDGDFYSWHVGKPPLSPPVPLPPPCSQPPGTDLKRRRFPHQVIQLYGWGSYLLFQPPQNRIVRDQIICVVLQLLVLNNYLT